MPLVPARFVPMFVLLLAVLVAPPVVHGQASDAPLRKPATWAEFTAHLVDNNDLGWWEARGTTTDVWKTLPAGIDYHYRAQIRLDDSRRQVVRTFTYVDSDGRLISSGSETIVWDDKSKNAIWSISGFDEDRPWSDSGRLVGFDATRMVVASVEKAAGETYELRTTMERTGPNTRRRTIARPDGKGTPFSQVFTRVNHFKEAFNGWDPTGTWITDFGGMKIAGEASWSADGRCVISREGPRMPDGSIQVTGTSLTWFDLDRRTIRQKYVSSIGMTLDGEVIEVSENRLVMRFTGTDAEGVALDAIVTSELKGDVLTRRFSDMHYGGEATMPEWATMPMVSTRER